MSVSKFPNEQNSKLVDENGLPIDSTNPLNVTGNVNATITNAQVEVTNDAGNAIPISGNVGITGTPSVTVTNVVGNPVPTTITNSPSVNATILGGNVGINTAANTVKIDQATAGANHIQLADSTNASHVAKVDNNGSLNTKVTNDTAGAIPIKITDGVDTADLVDISGDKYLRVTTPTGGNPVNNSYTAIVDDSTATSVTVTNNNALKVDGSAVTQPVSGTVNIGTMPSITVSDVGIKTTANTVKIDSSNNLVKIDSTTNTVKVDTSNQPINITSIGGVPVFNDINNPIFAEINNGLGNPIGVSGTVTVGNTSAIGVSISNTPNVAISGTPSVNATIQGVPSVNANITNVVGNPIPATITNTPSVVVSGTPTVNLGATNTIKIDQATANANHVELVDGSGNAIGQSSANPIHVTPNTTPVVNMAGDVLDVEIKNGGNTAAVDANGALSVKFPSAQNVNVSNSPTVSIQQGIAGANHVEIVNSGGLPNDSANPLFTSTTISGTPNVNISNASVNVSASSNLPIQGTVGISSINGVNPTIDAQGLAVKVHSGQISLTDTGNLVKIDQATPNANHVEVVNSAGTANGAGAPLFTSTVVTNDVYTLPDTRHDMAGISEFRTFWRATPFTLVNNAGQTLVTGITGYKFRIDKVYINTDPTLASTAPGNTFQLRNTSGTIIYDCFLGKAQSAGNNEDFLFEPPFGGLFLAVGEGLQLYNVNTSSSTPSEFRATIFGAFV
ncbi:hypothetical protein UFOVP453_57 [uncultured Caudovirales phage]|uniref:Uncharacterized protein n=1 Tax=uncultured Caudovirales phage TaxID=2100421 RepID=A0A6J5MHT1_9CAUD|nr:hypothetical protein UFOVP453_57 [uncultured Caudovirales phage]